MNTIEREAIILESGWEMIDDMVNWAMFVKHERSAPTNLLFQTHLHARLFNILLGDFLSEVRAFRSQSVPLGLLPAPTNARPSDLTFLFHLRQVCADPQLGDNVTELRQAVEAFGTWLEVEFVASGVNLHDIDVVADLRVARYRYLRMCGDIAKHQLARLETNVRHLQRMLQEAGHPVSEQDTYLAIPTFFEWFHENIFIYHSSYIAEFLNNIRWAVYGYLQPEFRRSFHLTELATRNFPHYAFRYPDGVEEPVARAMYWNLLNRCRSAPFVQRFVVSESFKARY